jgi:hypothetical protein
MSRWALGAILIHGLLAAPAWAQEPGLSARHRHMLKALGYPVVMPAYVPAGYQVARVEVLWVAGQGPGDGPEYAVTWHCMTCKSGPMPFTVRAASGGFGGPGGEVQHVLSHPRYGRLTLEEFKPTAEGGHLLDLAHRYYMLNWFGAGPLYYSLVTDGDSPAPALSELKRVIQSLRPL